MSKKSAGGGPNIGLLLIIPAAAIAARAAMRHRQMLWAEGAVPGSPMRHRHGHGPWGPTFDPDAARGEVRLPPRIESILEQWHTRAHQAESPEGELRA